MLRIHRGLSVLIIVALLVTLLGEALPLKAASSLRGAILSEAERSRRMATAAFTLPQPG